MDSKFYGSNTIVNGIYYPDNKGFWHQEDFISQIKNIKTNLYRKGKKPFKYKSFAIIVPHAGYSACGDTLVKTYDSVDWSLISEAIMLCTFHANKNEIIIPSFKEIKYDSNQVISISDKISALKNNPLFVEEDSYFINEHSFRNQLPLLLFFKKDIKIIPLLVGRINPLPNKIEIELSKLFTSNKTLFIVNTDLTHYGENYSNRFDLDILGQQCSVNSKNGEIAINKNELSCIKKKDIKFIESILAEDKKEVKQYSNSVCGKNAILLWLVILSHLRSTNNNTNNAPKIISYSSSYKYKTPEKSLVTYVGINYPIFYVPELENLVRLPRKIMATVRDIYHENPNIDFTDTRSLSQQVKNRLNINYPYDICKGIFVTIEKLDKLAGCIGIFYKDACNSKLNLVDVIIKYTLLSAYSDSRFVSSFLTSEGLDKISSPNYYRFKLNFLEDSFPIKIEDFWEKYIPCLHGITLEDNNLHATFLASVMPENNWVHCGEPTELDKKKSENIIFSHLLKKMGSKKTKFNPETMKISLYPNYEFID